MHLSMHNQLPAGFSVVHLVSNKTHPFFFIFFFLILGNCGRTTHKPFHGSSEMSVSCLPWFTLFCKTPSWGCIAGEINYLEYSQAVLLECYRNLPHQNFHCCLDEGLGRQVWEFCGIQTGIGLQAS